MVKYIPNQGDIIFLDFNPTIGHKQKGKRTALVLSNREFNFYTNMALVCPITSNTKEFPLHVMLSSEQKIKGVVMCEQIKTVDYVARNAKFIEKIEKTKYDEILEVIKSIIAIEK